ncbi:MAG: hypothetical protein LBC72_04320, partial [Spirochaetaceae bacterium]|nr:hypothetical protein [Spirochaetaceae bacterium]
MTGRIRLLFFLIFLDISWHGGVYAEDGGQWGGFLDDGYRRVGYNYNAPPARDGADRTGGDGRVQSGGTADEIRALVEHGAPDALKQALSLITQRGLASSEFGRLMGSIALTLLEKVYGEKNPGSLRIDFPQTHRYSKIIKEAESGRYVAAGAGTAAGAASQDYLDLTLPFLALLNETLVSKLSSALPDLEKARRINPDGALAAY